MPTPQAPPVVAVPPASAPAPAAPPVPAAPPLSLEQAFEQALGGVNLPAEAALPIAKLPPPAAPTAPAAAAPAVPPPVAVPAPTAPPVEPVTPPVTAPTVPDDPLGDLTAATADLVPAAPPAPPAEPLPTLPPDAPEKTQTAFATVTRKLSAAETQIKELEGKIAGAATADPKVPQLETQLASEREKATHLENMMAIIKLEATPKFQNEVTNPINAVISALDTLSQANQGDARALFGALRENDPLKRREMVKAATASWDPVDALEARTKLDQLATMSARRDELLKNSRANYEAAVKEEETVKVQKRAQWQTDAKQAYDDTWPKFLKALPFLQADDDNVEMKTALAQVRQRAEMYDSKPLSHSQRAALTYQAAALPLVINVLKKIGEPLFAENKALKQQIAELRGATPGAGEGSASAATADLPNSLGFVDAIEQRMAAGS